MERTGRICLVRSRYGRSADDLSRTDFFSLSRALGLVVCPLGDFAGFAGLLDDQVVAIGLDYALEL